MKGMGSPHHITPYRPTLRIQVTRGESERSSVSNLARSVSQVFFDICARIDRITHFDIDDLPVPLYVQDKSKIQKDTQLVDCSVIRK
jgi:phenylpyruvate tautomerase PptA (4-oxalocrotonate tautomerase family)